MINGLKCPNSKTPPTQKNRMNPHSSTRKHYRTLNPWFRFLGAGAALTVASGVLTRDLQAQTLHVGGNGVITDEVLTTTANVAKVPIAGHWRASGGAGVVYSNLKSPTLTVANAGNVTLKFNHRYYLETAYDGGAVYISVNGGAATYVPASAFSANAYTATLSGSSVFTGLAVFNGLSAGWGTPAQIESIASLGPFNPGDTLAISFRGGWDEGYAESAPNWEIGTVEVTDSISTSMLNVNFLNGSGGFTATSDEALAGPWVYTRALNQFEIDGDTLVADRYAPDSPGPTTVIDISEADFSVALLAGTLNPGDSFNLFDLAGGTTLAGTYHSITLPNGTWDVSNLGVTGAITYVADPPPVSSYAVNFDKGYQASAAPISAASNFGPPGAQQLNWNNVHAPTDVNSGPWNATFSITDSNNTNPLNVTIHMNNAGGNDGPGGGATDFDKLYNGRLRDNDGVITITTTPAMAAYSVYVYALSPAQVKAHLAVDNTVFNSGFESYSSAASFTLNTNYRVYTGLTGPLEIKITNTVCGFQIVPEEASPPSPFESWAQIHITAIDAQADASETGDPDHDGSNNLTEFAFNGDPLSGASNGRIYVLSEDSDYAGDPSAAKELILTVAVRDGTPAFAGSPSPSASHDGITYNIQGSLTLAGFTTAVNVVPTPITNGIPGAGSGYEYRSFSLEGSDGLPASGFMRAGVSSP